MRIHHWFIATKKNDFHPIALRTTGLLVFLALFIAIPFIYNVTSTKQFKVLGYATDININDLNRLSNQERVNAGLSPLALNQSLNKAALAKANNMIANNYWAHVAPDGTTPWSFIIASGYDYSAAGENLAKGFNTSSGVVSGWMASTLHRENILNSNYRDVGYAVVNGSLVGSETTLVVAMYGVINNTVATVPTNNNQVPSTNPTTDTTNTKLLSNISQSSAGEVAGLSVSTPIKVYNSLNWGQKVSILLVSTMILLFIMKHTMVWRAQKRGVRSVWLRSHPLGQVAVLTSVLIITIFSGVGVVL